MCNEYEFRTLWQEYEEMMARESLAVTIEPDALPNLPSIRIGDFGPVLRTAGNAAGIVSMRFGLEGPRGAPVFNFRSEGRNFGKSDRCLILASAFFEFTGSTYPKTKHRFTAADGKLMAIAGIWRPSRDGDRFAMLTVEPGPDVAPIHNRQIVILPRGRWSQWLYPAEDLASLLVPSPANTLVSEVTRKGSG